MTGGPVVTEEMKERWSRPVDARVILENEIKTLDGYVTNPAMKGTNLAEWALTLKEKVSSIVEGGEITRDRAIEEITSRISAIERDLLKTTEEQGKLAAGAMDLNVYSVLGLLWERNRMELLKKGLAVGVSGSSPQTEVS